MFTKIKEAYYSGKIIDSIPEALTEVPPRITFADYPKNKLLKDLLVHIGLLPKIEPLPLLNKTLSNSNVYRHHDAPS